MNGYYRFRMFAAALMCMVGLGAPGTGRAQDSSAGLTDWLNEEIERSVQVAVGSRSLTNQVETPAVAATSTSLVDTSSASDLIGIALNLADLSAVSGQSNDQKKATSTSATVSAYALFAAINSKDPLDPSVYCPAHADVSPWQNPKNWRRLSFTVGLDDKAGDPGSKSNRDPIIAGAKWLAYNGRDVCNQEAFKGVHDALRSAAVKFGDVRGRVVDDLFKQFMSADNPPTALRDAWEHERHMIKEAGIRAELATAHAHGETLNPDDAWKHRLTKMAAAQLKQHPGLTATHAEALVQATIDREAFENLLADGATLDMVLAALGTDRRSVASRTLTPADVATFVALNTATMAAIEDFRKMPQASVSFTSKIRDGGSDEYSARAVADVGLVRRVNLTFNGSFDDEQNVMGDDRRGGSVAVQLQLQPMRDALVGPKPLRFSVAFEAAAKTHVGPTYSGQFKINLPIPRSDLFPGLELPLSLTVANRSELVHETEVRGLVGFTIDTTDVLKTLKSKLPI
jgi:hypothetical protein